jgi:hypothetical protein
MQILICYKLLILLSVRDSIRANGHPVPFADPQWNGERGCNKKLPHPEGLEGLGV